jgi:hypothetical protein
LIETSTCLGNVDFTAGSRYDDILEGYADIPLTAIKEKDGL